MILRVAFPICTNCPPSKNTCFNGIFAYVRNAMARSAPIEDATTSSISLIPWFPKIVQSVVSHLFCFDTSVRSNTQSMLA